MLAFTIVNFTNYHCVHSLSTRAPNNRVSSVNKVWFTACLFSLSLCANLSEAQAIEPAPDLAHIIVMEKSTNISNSVLASKIPLPKTDVPIAAEIVDQEIIDRLKFNGLGPMLQASTSIVSNPTDGGFNDIMLRGFSSTPIYRNGINDSFGLMPPRVLANIQHIEVLKGPYGALYGPGEPGGSINFVTKRPSSDRMTNVAVGLGSRNEAIFQLDSTGPLATQADVDYRLIARREQADFFRDFTKRDRLFVNPMLSWDPRDNFNFEASFEYIRDERLLDTGIVAIAETFALPDERFLGEPSSGPIDTSGYTLQLESNYRLNADWELEVALHAQKTVFQGLGVEPDELITGPGLITLNRSATRFNEISKAVVAQAEIAGATKWSGIEQHLVAGFSSTAVNEEAEFLASDSDTNPFAIDPFRPVYGATRPALELERDSSEKTRQISVYAQDLLKFGPHWRLLLGLRFDHIVQSGSDLVSSFDRTSNELSPRIGLVYKPTELWSWFASFSTSIDPNEGLRPDGSGLAPTDSESVEVGLRWRSQAYPLEVDVSLFGTRQNNVTTDAPGAPGFELQSAAQESIGADFEIKFDPRKWFSLRAHYNFTDAQILDDQFVRDGTTPLNVAKHQFGALGLFTASTRRPNDLSVSVSLNYLSDRQGSIEPEELGLKLPAYFRGDLFLSWNYSYNFRFDIGIENFTDTNYLRGSQSDGLHLFPGEPINFRTQLNIRF